jgi:nucleotide-binding universal stress UspA family protein
VRALSLVKAATEWMADKILIGAHGHSPNRLFAESVSQAVAQHALCSVELIRLREPSEPSENLPAAEAKAKYRS